MKNLLLGTFLLALLTVSAFPQSNIIYQYYPFIDDFSGIKDCNGNTSLFYRNNSSYKLNDTVYGSNNFYHLDVSSGSDTLYIKAYYIDSPHNLIIQETLEDFDLWNNDPKKFVYTTGVMTQSKTYNVDYYINSYFGDHLWHSEYMTQPRYLSTYNYNDSTFCFSNRSATFMYLYTTKYDGSTSTFMGLGGDISGVSHSPFNDSVFFGINESAELYKTTDEWDTRYRVDTTKDYGSDPDNPTSKTMFYDKNQNYIYRAVYKNKTLRVSNNKGEPSSWQEKFRSTSHILISNDPFVEGLLFLATGRNIYKSTNYGDNFSLYKTLDKTITGIHKVPGKDEVYAATYFNIYKITSSDITSIKNLYNKDQVNFDPIDVNNKWVYQVAHKDQGVTQYSYIKLKEVLKDTTCNNKEYKKIKYSSIYTDYTDITFEYQRIDTSNALVYRLNYAGIEYVVDNLNIMPWYDSVYYSRFYTENPITILDSVRTFNEFGSDTYKRYYRTYGLGMSDISYSLARGFGFVYLRKDMEDISEVEVLKGCYLKEVVYGDTNAIVSVSDEINTTPAEYSISQNYPNPFNPSTTINYSLAKEGNVKLTIYDALGSTVATIVNEYKPAGNYSVQFNAANLASGIYLYRLESGSYSAAKKFLLIK